MLFGHGGIALDIEYYIVKTGYTLFLHLYIDLFLCNMTIKKTSGNGCDRFAQRERWNGGPYKKGAEGS